MDRKLIKENMPEAQVVLDAVRRIVKSLRSFSKYTEKEFGLSTAQIYVLEKLVEVGRPLSVNELAEATLTHQSSASVVISKLVNRKLVDRTIREDDSRSVKLSISKQGAYLLSKSPKSIQERLVVGLGQMSPKERKGLVDGLQSLIQKAGLQSEDATMLLEDDDK
ncbi:MarR family protein [compost metagenome]